MPQPSPDLISESDRTWLSPFFWDVAIETVDIKKNRKFVIERLLRFGRPKEVLWILGHYTSQEIVEVVQQSKTIDARTATYWAAHFTISKKEIACLNLRSADQLFY
jgi:hypothetical protein